MTPYVPTEPAPEPPDTKAIRLLNRQLGHLQIIRGLNYKHAEFKAWRDTTMSILERSLGPTSQHTVRFRDTRFFGPSYAPRYGLRVPPPDYISPRDAAAFKMGCETTEASLKAAIDEIAEFGLFTGDSRPAPTGRGRSGAGVRQTFSGTVHLNQAIATDSAVQRIGRVGNETGVDLKELSALLQQSQDLSPNQARQGVADVEALAVEIEKPEERRNWRSVLDCGQRVLELAGKAADLGAKLGPYLPAVAGLVDKAKHALT